MSRMAASVPNVDPHAKSTWVWWVLPVLAALAWYGVLSATALNRVQSMNVTGSGSFAVFNQIYWNYSQVGHFQQTIHAGYSDNWTWGGHRAPMLFVVSLLYGLAPEPITLCRIQIAALALGAFPAFGLGWRAFGRPLGGVAALAMYLAYPPLQVLALSDYQDIILGIPFAVLAVHQAWRGSPWGFALAILGVVCSREEWILVAPFLGFLSPGGVRARLRWGVGGLAVVLFYFGILWSVAYNTGFHYSPSDAPSGSLREKLDIPGTWEASLDRARRILAPIPYVEVARQPEEERVVTPSNPVAGGAPDLRNWEASWLGRREITRTWKDVRGFYLDLGVPVHLVGVFAPAALIPAMGVLVVHLTAPLGQGVDSRWGEMVHHISPLVALLVLAAILGAGFCYRRTAARRGLWLFLAGVGALLVVQVNLDWGRHQKLATWGRSAKAPVPEWALVAGLPTEAILATDMDASLIISSRPLAYTYDDSILEKAPRRGLLAVEYLLVRRTSRGWVELARDRHRASLIAETPDYLLFRMPWVRPAHSPAAGPGAGPAANRPTEHPFGRTRSTAP